MEPRDRPAETALAASQDRRWRARRLLISVGLVVLCLLQEPGRIASDTKVDLPIDPWRLMERAVQLWDSQGFAGQVQNQAYGYLFPMGPFFAGFESLGLPPWIVQRLWWGLILVVAFLGAERLMRELRIGSPLGQVVGALAFALAPRVLSVMGTTSVEAYPGALAPWILLPLVACTKTARIGIWRAALLSAAAMAMMGGVNATVNLAATLPAVLWLVTRRAGSRSFALIGTWGACAAAATAWWVLPLLQLSRYGTEFLSYIESSTDTTHVTNLAEVIRGTSHWVGFLGQGLGSIWQIGSDLTLLRPYVMITLLVALAGLVGIAFHRGGERLWLVTCLVVGVLLVTLGHVEGSGNWFAESQRMALDGVLAPLRNVHKFDVLIRLAIAIGVASLIEILATRSVRARLGVSAAMWQAIVGSAVVAVAAPMLFGRVAPLGTYIDVPGYWIDASSWIDDHPHGRTLVAPGSRFGRYYWGVTGDDVYQALTDSPWEVRNAVPLTNSGFIRAQDAVERRFQTGQASSGLADFVRSQGIGYVLVRNELAGDVPHAREGFVRSVLVESGGFTKVASFGPEVGPSSVFGVIRDANLMPRTKAVEVWRVDDPAGTSVTPLSQVASVSGDPQSLLDLADADVLPPASIMTAEDAEPRIAGGDEVLTDSFRRREVNFGRIGNNESSTLTPQDPLAFVRAKHDYTSYDPIEHGTTGAWVGVDGVDVSSSSAVADAPDIDQGRSARAMFDDDPSTSWSAATDTVGLSQVVRIRLASERRLGVVTVEFPEVLRERITNVSATTDKRDGHAGVRRPDGAWDIAIDSAVASDIVIQLDQAAASGLPMQVSSLSVEGLPIAYELRMADDLGAIATTILGTSTAGHSDGCVSTTVVPFRCAANLVHQAEDDSFSSRVFSLSSRREYALTGRFAATPGKSLDAWYERLVEPRTAITASSSAVDLPEASAVAVMDGNTDSTWTARPDDASPTLRLSFDEPVTLDGFALQFQDDMPATRPSAVTVRAGKREYDSDVSASGEVTFPELTAKRIEIEFATIGLTQNFDPTTGRTSYLGVGVSEIEIPGVDSDPVPDTEEVSVTCADGPVVDVDGRQTRLALTSTVGELLTGRSMEAKACGGPVDLDGGEHRITSVPDSPWRMVQWRLQAESDGKREASPISVDVEHWGDADRSLAVGARTEDSLLVVTENANVGWRAELDGTALRSVTVDGWKQGYVLPAGAAGTVTLEFPAAERFVWLLTGGLALGLAVLMAALLWRRPGKVAPCPPYRGRLPLLLVLVAGLALISGTVGLVAALVAVVAGTRVDTVPMRAVGIAAFVIAGAMLVVHPAGSGQYAGNDPIVQTLMTIALAFSVVPVRRSPSP